MNCDLYQILNVDRNSTQDELKKAYKKLCIKHHPDKGGDEQEFKKISEAYNILKDPEKRQTYDRFGMDGLQQGMGSVNEEEMQSMMNNLFGSSFFPGFPGRPSSVKKSIQLELSLEDVVKGNSQFIYHHHRQIIDKSKIMEKCNVCKGEGKRMMTSSVGFMQMMQQVICPQCNGKGYDNIHYKTIKEEINVPIPKNCPEHHKFILKHKMDEEINGQSGDIILDVIYKSHSIYKRNEYQLYYPLTINYMESLFGFQRHIQLLNGQFITIVYPSILKVNEMLYIPKYGLYNQQTKNNESLYFIITIEYPNDISKSSLLQMISQYNQENLSNKNDSILLKTISMYDNIFNKQSSHHQHQQQHHQQHQHHQQECTHQ